MKKVKISGKLQLNKEKIANLNPEEQKSVLGGYPPWPPNTKADTYACGTCGPTQGCQTGVLSGCTACTCSAAG